jgi:hypothetical protein
MTKDYAVNLATAKRLVRKNGRQVTLCKLDAVSADAQKPWLGAADPAATASTTSLYAVAVPPSSAIALGLSAKQADLMKSVEQILICEPGETDPENIETYNTVLDNSVEYKITFVEKLKPATLTLLYFIGVSR